MERKKIIILISFIVFLFIIGLGLYLKSYDEKPIKKEEKEKRFSEEEKLLLDRYRYSELQNYFANYKIKTFEEWIKQVKKDKENKAIKITQDWFEVEKYYKDNQTIYCLKFFDKEKKCAYAQGQKFDFLEQELEEDEIKIQEKEKSFIEYLIKNDLIKILEKSTDAVVANQSCKKLKYKLNYKELDLTKLKEMEKKGIDYKNFGVGYITEFEEEDCFDYKNGVNLYKKSKYRDIFGREQEYFFEMLKIEIGKAKVELPNITSTMEKILQMKDKIDTIKKGLDSCLNKAEKKENCYFLVAIDNNEPEVCQLLKENKEAKEDCFYQYAIRTGLVEFCSRTGQKVDYCYIDYVALNKEKNLTSYCKMIKNQTILEECLKFYQNQSNT
ncbi:MAG: hypothetical protein NC918_00075 [Candidatus Omnitrophica bacterium]|nr:hypothetical protein [Candidatus Omnitrophota bacterium]